VSARYARDLRLLEARALLTGKHLEPRRIIKTLERVRAIRTTDDGEIEALRNGRWVVSPTLTEAHDADPQSLEEAAQAAGIAIHYR